MLIVFFERIDRRLFCRRTIGVSGIPHWPYCVCKTNMAACELRIKCCNLESCCSFDGSFPSRSTNDLRRGEPLGRSGGMLACSPGEF